MTHAPASISYLPGAAPPTCVRNANPGDLFVLADKQTLYAPLSHSNVDVVDVTHRWCVVVAARSPDVGPVGRLVAIPCNTAMTRVRVVNGLQIAPLETAH